MPGPTAFDPASIDEATRAYVDALLAMPAPPSIDLIQLRSVFAQRAAGISPTSAHARTIATPGPDGPLELRVIDAPNPVAVLLHIHGGGWALGSSRLSDALLERFVRDLGVTAVSVEYRLAPEHPYPAAVDDCEAAARYVLDQGASELGSERLVLLGESAGSTLTLAALLRLRDTNALDHVLGALLHCGVYDLAMTPSQRQWGRGRGIVDTEALRRFADAYAPADRHRDPDVSPLHGELAGLPPIQISVGTLDLLLDDSLFLYARLLAARVACEMVLLPGGTHGFDLGPSRCPSPNSCASGKRRSWRHCSETAHAVSWVDHSAIVSGASSNARISARRSVATRPRRTSRRATSASSTRSTRDARVGS
jgi:acetyl esterase/lipase